MGGPSAPCSPGWALSGGPKSTHLAAGNELRAFYFPHTQPVCRFAYSSAARFLIVATGPCTQPASLLVDPPHSMALSFRSALPLGGATSSSRHSSSSRLHAVPALSRGSSRRDQSVAVQALSSAFLGAGVAGTRKCSGGRRATLPSSRSRRGGLRVKAMFERFTEKVRGRGAFFARCLQHHTRVSPPH